MSYIQSSLYNSGTNLTFDVSPDMGIAYGRDLAVLQAETIGGDEFTVQQHTGKKTWSWSWSFISSSFKTSLEGFRDAVGGSYQSFTYNDGTSYTVRMSADSLQFTEVSPDVYSTSFKIREVSAS
jgi:hypothetical protein